MQDIRQSVVAAFLDRCGALAPLISVYANPTEEIDHALNTKAPVKMFAAGARMLSNGGGARSRLEENYLFDTRRFASGAISPGSNMFFASAVGQPGSNNGFINSMVMTTVETNMLTASQIPQGRDFVLTGIGISFNSGIAVADAAILMECGALEYSKQGGQFTLQHGPAVLWPGGTGLDTAATATGRNGRPDIRATRKLAVPRVIKAGETFNYNYNIPRAVTNLDNSTAFSLSAACLMRIWLWGGQQDRITA
jgi:hypothetical protein